MREFNTAGPCNPKLHYTVLREDLIVQGKEKVRKGRYFTLFAPRQSGKTTYFQLLSQALKAENFIPIWITFEDLKSATKEVFYQDLNHQLHHALQKYKITSESQITNQVDLRNLFEGIQHKSIVLIIDEFEGIPAIVLSEVMHAFRRMYHQKEDHALHSLLLIGVSTIAELVTSEASPFNIVEELQISYFTESEVTHLIKEYVNESGQQFDTQVIKAIYDNTKGQPGLVCALAAHLLQTVPHRTVTMEDFGGTLDYFLTAKYNKNILNIIQKSKEKQDFMYRLLFGDQAMDFNIYHQDIAYLYANGVIDNIKAVVGIPVPLYSKCIISAFRPMVNGERSHYGLKVNTSFEEYMQDNGLNMHAILNKYTQYIRKRGFKAFDTKKLKEGAWHYSLDGFINFFIEALEGHTFTEVPSGAGRTDILIVYKTYRYLIETKVFSNNTLLKRGKGQLAEYLKSEDLEEGYYVVFSSLHTDQDTLYFEDTIQGKQIYTYIICTHFPTPSRLPVPDELKVIATELMTRRHNILEVLALHFDPPSSVYRKIEQDLLKFTEIAVLKKLLAAAVQSENIKMFQQMMDNH